MHSKVIHAGVSRCHVSDLAIHPRPGIVVYRLIYLHCVAYQPVDVTRDQCTTIRDLSDIDSKVVAMDTVTVELLMAHAGACVYF